MGEGLYPKPYKQGRWWLPKLGYLSGVLIGRESDYFIIIF